TRMGVNGILLSDGPGDPHENGEILTNLKDMLKLKLPLFGLCLGHQLLALANGAEICKMKYGHHGANQSVKDMETGRVYITTQNHNYAVVAESLNPAIATPKFINVNDKTCEGVAYANAPVFSVQFQPEVGGGTMDTAWLFDQFIEMIATKEEK
ncbi:MAG: gamma-glutamyl-gamma-aminobutyrate hydrolase family protein, partial [Oscillospiraceae bacterium]